MTNQVGFDTICCVETRLIGDIMGKIIYSYDDGQLYMLHGECTLRTLMKELLR